jgi:hypothetical protein
MRREASQPTKAGREEYFSGAKLRAAREAGRTRTRDATGREKRRRRRARARTRHSALSHRQFAHFFFLSGLGGGRQDRKFSLKVCFGEEAKGYAPLGYRRLLRRRMVSSALPPLPLRCISLRTHISSHSSSRDTAMRGRERTGLRKSPSTSGVLARSSPGDGGCSVLTVTLLRAVGPPSAPRRMHKAEQGSLALRQGGLFFAAGCLPDSGRQVSWFLGNVAFHPLHQTSCFRNGKR